MAGAVLARPPEVAEVAGAVPARRRPGGPA